MNANDFTNDISEEIQAIVTQAEEALEKTGVYGWNLVTAATPVLTGRARASWLLNVDFAKDTTVPPAKSKTRVYADPVVPKVSFDINRNQALVVSNNVEYIDVLEHGGGRRTAFAMVATAKPKIDRELNRRLKKIK